MAKRFGVKGKVMAKLFAITPVYLSCERLDLKIPQKLFRKKSARRYSQRSILRECKCPSLQASHLSDICIMRPFVAARLLSEAGDTDTNYLLWYYTFFSVVERGYPTSSSNKQHHIPNFLDQNKTTELLATH